MCNDEGGGFMEGFFELGIGLKVTNTTLLQFNSSG